MTSPAPLWLARPSRFARLARTRARIALGVLLLLLVASLSALTTIGPPPVSGDPARRGDDQTDIILYESIVAGVRHGGDYYRVAADALRAGNYPLRPFITFRLPGLAMVEARLPPLAVLATLYLLSFSVFCVWTMRLRAALTRWPPVAIGLALMAGGMMAFVQAGLWAFHEIWAGLLVALSLGLRRPGRWIEAVAIGLIAMLIRETSALYVVIMAGMAWREGQRREAIGWSVALLLFAGALGAHAWAVHAVTNPLDPLSPGWAGLQGFGFFVQALVLATSLQLFPLWAGALLVALTLFGWAAWDHPLATRMLGIFAAYGALLALFARPDTFYWALMIAPLSLIGLVFVPDALRDLMRQALDRRRITVTRVTR